MKQSYCGLCENCRIDKPDFLEAIGKVKEYIGQPPMYFWGIAFQETKAFL